jgi:hypothetical protein
MSMFLYESKEVKNYEKTSKYGKLVSYTRTKTLTHWKCDNCGEEFSKIRNGKYDTNSKSYCKTCISKIGLNKLASLAGYESKVKNQFEPKVGSVIIDKDGYRQIYIGKNYPYRNGGYTHIREHQYVMELHLERRLKKGEIVHHIDGDKKNNNLDNLFLTSVEEHNKLHAESESILFDLYKKGIIGFDRTTGRYFLQEGKV